MILEIQSFSCVTVESDWDEVYYKLIPKRTDFSLVFSEKLKTAVHQLIVLIIISSLLASCASQKPQQVRKVPSDKKVTAQPLVNAQDHINKSKEQQANEAISSMLIASELFLQEQNPLQALWLANQIEPLLSSEEEKYSATLVKSEALLSLGYIHESLAQLEKLEANNVQPNARYFKLLSQIKSQQGFPVVALSAKLAEFEISTNASLDDVETIWQTFQTLTPWQLAEIESQELPYGKGWVRLIQFANKFGSNDAQFKRYLQQWQRQYPTHPANLLMERITSSLDDIALARENIAVILPLTGKQKAAGNAAQQGLLSAYANQPNNKLHFFDSQTLNWETLTEQLAEKEVDMVIGPLLRNNVAKYLAIEELTLPSLLLNLPQNIALKAHQFAISMRPEDEALQAAATLTKKQFKMPIVLVHQDAVSQRIASTFIEEWQRLTGDTPRLMPFKKGKKMQSMLKTALGVFQSEARIKDLNNRVKHTIKADARNRRDVDMIYIVGSPTQTRLLKPYIDVSISPFADMIPIYASSRSHSAKIDESDTRDLAGLTFTEMPWLLTSQQQNKALKNLANTLFPERSDSLQRIFAMGFDALTLANKVEKMKTRPYIKHFGQTGVLTLNNDNILTRSLIWGKYQKTSVTEIAMD